MSESSTGGAPRHPDLLGVYCNDHLAAATGGIELVSRMLSTHKGDRFEEPLEQLLSELREEKTAYLAIMSALGIPVRQRATVADKQDEATYGIGGRWHVARNWAIFAEWMKNDKIEVDSYVVGVDFKF